MHETVPTSAGAYLQHCREAAGLGVRQAAASLAALPWAVGKPTAADVTRLALRLNEAEADAHPFTEREAELVGAAFEFDAALYVALQAAPARCADLPLRGCAQAAAGDSAPTIAQQVPA